MDSQMDTALLVKRFPNRAVEDFGDLVKDFFCARSVGSATYGGRLFVMRKTLVFVSAYSNSRSYDCCVPLSDITMATTFHRSIIPSLEIERDDSKESYTNFYDLKAIEKTLRDLLPDGKVVVKQAQTAQTGLNRMMSVPGTKLSAEAAPKAAPCHFFSKCGFCPRQAVCRLDHTFHTAPPLSNQSSRSEAAAAVGESSKVGRGRALRSPSKKPHLLESSDERTVGSASSSNGSVAMAIKRSLSHPAESVAMKATPRSKTSKLTSKETSGKESDSGTKRTSQNRNGSSGPVSGTEQTAELISTTDISPTATNLPQLDSGSTSNSNLTSDSSSASNSLSSANRGHQFSEEELVQELPKSFDFSSQLSVSSASEGFHTPEGDFPASGSRRSLSLSEEQEEQQQEQGEREGVFVFSASASSSSSSPLSRRPHHSSRRRNAAATSGEVPQLATPPLKGEGQGVGFGDETVSSEAAMLHQQLELASDDDSLHGDLDIETQLRIMESFSAHDASSSTTPPPPYSSVVPNPFAPLAEQDQQGASEGGGAGGRSQKRQPCLYFLSGYCKKGTECPDYHGMNPDSFEDLEYEHISMVPIPDCIKVHSGSSIGRGDINSGDKIILPPHILVACEQRELSYPIAFKLENLILGKVVYGGVLQFTSPSPNSAYLPQWMLDHLGAGEGEEVAFKHVDLPKGKFVQLQPVSSSWLAIPYDKRMAVMEFQLRNFQTLTEGTKVTLAYELNKYTLKVLKCEPASGISIVDSDLTTDIIEPADLQRYHSIEDGQAENIGLDEPKTCSLKVNAYRHFVLLALPGKPLPSKLRVEVQSSKGDTDLYLSQSFAAPSQSRYTWCSQEVGKSIIHLSALDDKSFDTNKPLYAGLMSMIEDAESAITVHPEDVSTKTTASPSPSSSSSSSAPSPGQTLRGVATPAGHDVGSGDHAAASESEPLPLPPGHQQCSYCGSVMPALRLLMHERHCLQSTFKCPLCKVCIPKTAEKKHHSISHQLLVCECGEEHTQLALHRHQQLDCNKRTVHCQFKWCNLSFPMDQLANHENICGRKKVDCPVCQEEVSQLELEIHMEAFHSVATESIDWNRPLTSQNLVFKQVEPKFKCPCGLAFEFQDDLQVHQLTECALKRLADDNETGENGAGLIPPDIHSSRSDWLERKQHQHS